jgi:hypothetical protein
VTHRYFSWIEDGRWQGNCLLSAQQISNLLQQFKWKHQAFASIQKFDNQGLVIGCPLYIDVDGDSKEGITANKMSQEIVLEIEDRYKVTPDIFFSGNKGYHIVVPIDIVHPQSHYVVLQMVNGLGCSGYSNIDRNVYSNRRMWRVNKSPASKPGYYKIRLTKQELFDFTTEEHRQFSQTNETKARPEFDPFKLDLTRWEEDLSLAIKQFEKGRQDYAKSIQQDKQARPWTACLTGLITSEPHEGERAKTAFILGRWFMQAGTDEHTALDEFLKHKHWNDFEEEERGVSKMLRSLYRSGRIPTLGCKYEGQDRDIMKRHCDQLCQYNEDWSLFA